MILLGIVLSFGDAIQSCNRLQTLNVSLDVEQNKVLGTDWELHFFICLLENYCIQVIATAICIVSVQKGIIILVAKPVRVEE